MSIVELQNRVNELKSQIDMYKSKRSSGSNPGPTYGFYTKHRKVYQYELSESERQERGKQLRKLRYALKKRDEEVHAQYELDHRKGYCPKCHMLIPMAYDKCPDCM